MNYLFNPQIISKEILTKLLNSTLEPTLDNIEYVWNFTASLNYGLCDLSDEAIDFWISLLPHLRNIYLQKEKELGLRNIEVVVFVCHICVQLMIKCAKKNKQIPNLIHILEGTLTNLPIPEKIVDFPLVPTEFGLLLSNKFEQLYTRYKQLHNFEIPSFNTIIQYSFLMAILYAKQNHQPIEIFDEFTNKINYKFSFPSDFSPAVTSLPAVDDPFAFIYIRATFENTMGCIIEPPITDQSTNPSVKITETILNSKDKIDQTQFYSALIYLAIFQVPLPLRLLTTDYSSLLFLMLLSQCFDDEVIFEKDYEFHFTSNFWMVYDFKKEFSEYLPPLESFINLQMKSLFSIACYVVNQLEPTPIEVICDDKASIEKKLLALASLKIDSINTDNLDSLINFWCFHCNKAISELTSSKVLPNDELLLALFLIYRSCIDFYVCFKTKKPFESVFLNEKLEEETILTPEVYPVMRLPSVSILSTFNDIQLEPIGNNKKFCMLIALLNYSTKLDNEFYSIADLKSSFTQIIIDNLIYRYFYEKVFNVKIKRETKDNLYTEIAAKEQFNQNDIFNDLFLYDDLHKIEPNPKIFSNKLIFYGLFASHAFTSDDLNKIIDSSLRNSIQIASYVITQCQDELQHLLTSSYYNDNKSSIELLKHKECITYLNNNSKSHLLLSILLNDKDQTFEETIIDYHLTAAKLFSCKNSNTKPPSTEILVNYLKSLFDALFDYSNIEDNINGTFYTCGLMTNAVKLMKTPEDFFLIRNIYSDYNTILFYLIEYLPVESHPELANYYINFAINGYIVNEIKDKLPKPSLDRSLLWFLYSLNSLNSMAEIKELKSILPETYIFPMFQFFLLRDEVNQLYDTLDLFFSSNRIEMIDEQYLEEAFYLFMECDYDSGIQILIEYLSSNKLEFLIRVIALVFNYYPKYALFISNKVKFTQELAIQLISNLPPLKKPLSNDSLSILTTVIGLLPHSYLNNPSHEIPALSVKWAEDEQEKVEKIDSNNQVNIWQREELVCLNDNNNEPHVAFYCHTCNMRNAYICAACIDSCHYGHRISYAKKTKFKCCCNQNNACTFCQKFKEKEANDNQKISSAPTSKLLNIFDCLAGTVPSNVSQLTSNIISNRFSNPISSIGLRPFDCRSVMPTVEFTTKKENFVDLRQLRIQNSGKFIQFIKKRSSYLPFRFTEHHSHYLFVALGKELKVFNDSTLDLVSTLTLRNELLSIKKALLNKDYLVLTSITSIQVLDTTNLKIIYDLEPKLGDCNHIIQAEMQMKDRLTVVTKLWVSVYDMNANPTAQPIESYVHKQDSITSAVFVQYNDNPYGIFAFNSGQIALQVFGSQKSPTFSRFSHIRSKFVSIFISYSEETNLFFIAAPGTALQYCRLENIFANDPQPTNQFHSDCMPGEVVFYDSFPNVPTYLLFVQLSSNSLYSVEFTDEAIELAAIYDDRTNQIRLFDMNFNIYSIVKTPFNILAINSHGDLMELKGCPRFEPKNEYHAPATFYSYCEVASKSQAEIKGTDGSQNYNTLFSDSVAFFHTSVSRKIMTLILKDTSYSIVGFMLSFGNHGMNHRPSYISVFDRKYSCTSECNVMVSLKPNEVNPGKPLEIFFSNSAQSEIAMQGIRIFIIKSERILSFLKTVDFGLSNSNKLSGFLEFIDSEIEPKGNEDSTLYTLATSISPTEDEKIDEQSFISVVDTMYQIPQSAMFARSAVIRIVTVRKEFIQIWAKELAKLIHNNKINESLWQLAWRDYNTIPAEYITPIKEVLWDSNPKLGSADSIISAFTFV